MFRNWCRVGKAVMCSAPHRPQTKVTRSLQAMTSLSSRRNISPASYMLLVIPGAAFCLGCWQVQRLQWKVALVKDLQDKVNQPPIPLPKELEKVAGLEYQRVSFKGTFHHDREMLYGPRPQMISGEYKDTGSLVSSGSSGFLVITPFTLQDSGITILVNRGWVGKHQKKPEKRPEGQIEGVQELTGVIRLEESRPPFLPKTHNNSEFFLYRDIASMSLMAGRDCAPVYVDACEGVKGGPKAGQTRVTLRNEHLSYLLTWYSLSFVTGFLWYRKYINIRAFV